MHLLWRYWIVRLNRRGVTIEDEKGHPIVEPHADVDGLSESTNKVYHEA